MRKFMILFAGGLILFVLTVSLSGASTGAVASTGLERAYNRCLEGCVELEGSACQACCEKAFEPVVMRCRIRFIECVDVCGNSNTCRNQCIYKVSSCGTGEKGVHACP